MSLNSYTNIILPTLLMDLLTPLEDREYRNRFDIDMLADRLVRVTSYVSILPELQSCPIGFFGASTGAASALKAAARMGTMIEAIVSRGGRPDLAEEALTKVKTPVLLIVGSLDHDVTELNRKAFTLLPDQREMVVKIFSVAVKQSRKLPNNIKL